MKPMWVQEGIKRSRYENPEEKNISPSSYPHNNNTSSVFKNSDTHPFVPTHLCQLSTIQNPGGLVHKRIQVGGGEPTTVCRISPEEPTGNNGWYVSNVALTLVATDEVSGVDYTLYRINDGAWQQYTESFVVDSDGIHCIQYYSGDRVGNIEEEKSITIKIDKTSPTISFERPTYGYLYLMGKEILPLRRTVIIGKALITTTAYDETSGIEKVEFYIDDELKTTLTAGPYEWLWDERIIGTHTIKAIAYDKAGNMATIEQEVWIFNL